MKQELNLEGRNSYCTYFWKPVCYTNVTISGWTVNACILKSLCRSYICIILNGRNGGISSMVCFPPRSLGLQISWNRHTDTHTHTHTHRPSNPRCACVPILQLILLPILLPIYCPFYSSFYCHSTAHSTAIHFHSAAHSTAILLPILQFILLLTAYTLLSVLKWFVKIRGVVKPPGTSV